MNATALRLIAVIAVLLSASSIGLTDYLYQKPPQHVLEVFDAPPTPFLFLSPTRDAALLLDPVRYPPIAVLAEPMLRLAGVRINPNTNGEHNPFYAIGLTLVRMAGGAQTRVTLPSNARIGFPRWSADGKFVAFTNTGANGIELWLLETATAKTRRVEGVQINGALDGDPQWMPDQKTLLAKLVAAGRGAAPPPPKVPAGPNVQESSGQSGASSTYEVRDVLTSAHDENLFDYYASSQLALVDIATGKTSPIGRPAIYGMVRPAPDGQHILVERIHRPYSRQHPYDRFPKAVEIWNRTAERVHQLASLPLADQVPIGGVRTGPRNYGWRPTEPATLMWAEALDDGDFRKKVPHRDRLQTLKAPFKGAPVELFKTEHRFVGAMWGREGGLVLVNEYDRDRRWRRTFALNADAATPSPRLLWDLSANDRYKDPGFPVFEVLPNGFSAILQQGDFLYLNGMGASPEGNRPFLDRFNLKTLDSTRLFRCDKSSYETFAAWLDPAAGRFITRRESPSEPPNYVVRTLAGSAPVRAEPGEAVMASTPRAFTNFRDSTPQLRGISKRIVTYKRPDGVALSFTLYLPPGYKAGTRLPTVLWAYPLDYNDPNTAGQVVGSSQRFTSILGASHLFFLLNGYAIIDNPSMPVVGHPDTAYNTFIEQIVANAKAAIDKAVEIGVTDGERVGVGGHSHGGLMTTNLLAHSDLFRAGIARSGAYNHTMRPFGFQNEQRTLWEAPDVYVKLSPVMHANKIKEPLLLIHGELDANPGTVPLQSERLYQAVRGTGGTVRLVMLPLESHGYTSRQSTEHTIFEMLSWFDRHVKNASPRPQPPTPGGNE